MSNAIAMHISQVDDDDDCIYDDVGDAGNQDELGRFGDEDGT